jgi:hypothetical protein
MIGNRPIDIEIDGGVTPLKPRRWSPPLGKCAGRRLCRVQGAATKTPIAPTFPPSAQHPTAR